MNSHANFSQPVFQPTQSAPCKSGGNFNGWKGQFACPQGKWGRLVGQVMAIKNARMNRFAVEVLNPQLQDQVLEIGFGHGKAIEMIAERTTNGFVAGIDLSSVMVLQGAKRNQRFIKSGLVEVSQASVADIPYEFARFNKVLAVNNYQFWPNAEHNLTEIQRVLGEGGLLVLCLRLKTPGRLFQMAPGFTEQEIDEVVGLMRWVGFREVQLARRRVGYEAVCLIAKK